MPRFAANLGFLFTERPLIERFGAAAACGFTAVEGSFVYDVPAAALRAEIDRHGLTMLGINTWRGEDGEFGLASIPGREKDFDALFQQSFDYITTMGGRAVHVLAGLADPGGEAERAYISNIARAADLAASKDITVLIEPINPRDRPGYFLSRVEYAADLIAKIGRKNVRLQFDFYHVQIVSGDLIRRFEQHLPIIGHVQIASVPDRHEPDEGEVNYPEIYKVIDKAGYSGCVACEYRPRGRTEDGLGWGKEFGIGTGHSGARQRREPGIHNPNL